MFSSEQKFNVNGEDKNDLKQALELALSWKRTFPVAYKILDNSFVLYWNEVKGSSSFPPNTGLDTLVSIITDFLKNNENMNEFSFKVPKKNIDGSVEYGWQVYIPTYETDKESYHYAFLAIKHDWIYYHK